MHFRHRSHDDPAGRERAGSAVPHPREEPEPPAPARPSANGTYLTDGRSLFRVQHAITEADGLELEEALLELEDCSTLELILCSAGALERLGLRPVSPSGEDAAQARTGDAPQSGPPPASRVRL